jgi:hypothetical protein
VDAIVCVDACFTQKRRKSQGKAWAPPHKHCETIFIDPEEVATMENFVETVRPPRPPQKKSGRDDSSRHQAAESSNAQINSELDNDFEPGMHVPASVLNECRDSFVAADSNRIKASTLFFSDTGLMALLCRHDRVLWLVNMTSAGEKQHFVLCLLQKLFQHLPPEMRIGLLYDIGCQLHRSCLKFDFLSQYQDRIVFGISVFHAYGHQWACQIIYHPRKCKGFGLTDGEGCERLWSSLKPLIPSLRVSTYYNCIYALDTKIKHLDGKSLLGLGHWLKRKWVTTMHRKDEASETLDELAADGVSVAHLRAQWHDQVLEQTKPLKKQSKHLANIEIEGILALYKNIETYQEDISKYETMLETGEFESGATATDVQVILTEAKAKVKKQKTIIANRKAKLSVDGRLNLEKLLNNEFLKLRMNALALKQRIRDRLRQRKFELENLERSYRKTMNHMKLEKHAQSQLKRKEPGIQTLARKYNKLCNDLEKMINKKKAPRGAISPLAIEMDSLFKLDVDDDIWQDIGLTDDLDDSSEIPDWLGNDKVREGIKVLLEYDRCLEEMQRIRHERISMQEWFLEEWVVLQEALGCTTDNRVVYQLHEQEKRLLRICVTWEQATKGIPCELPNEWGPSQVELSNARKYELKEQVLIASDHNSDEGMEEDREEEDEEEEDMEEEDMENAELLDNMEMMALIDEFRLQL